MESSSLDPVEHPASEQARDEHAEADHAESDHAESHHAESHHSGSGHSTTTPRPPKHCSPEEIKAMEDWEFEETLEDDNVDLETIKECLKDPRADIARALRWRAYHGHLEVVKLIAEIYSASEKATDKQPIHIAFDWAATEGNLDVVKYLTDRFQGQLDDSLQSTAFGIASFSKEISEEEEQKLAEVMKYLLDKYPEKIDLRRSDGATLLHFAAKTKKKNVVECLMSRKAQPFGRDRTGKTAWEAVQPIISPDCLSEWVNRTVQKFDLPFVVSKRFHKGALSYGSYIFSRDIDGSFEKALAREANISDELADLNNSTNLLKIRQNNDLQFIFIIYRVSVFLGYIDDATIRILQFLSRTFLEQDAAERRLNFREPSYNVFSALLPFKTPDWKNWTPKQTNEEQKEEKAKEVQSLVSDDIQQPESDERLEEKETEQTGNKSPEDEARKGDEEEKKKPTEDEHMERNKESGKLEVDKPTEPTESSNKEGSGHNKDGFSNVESVKPSDHGDIEIPKPDEKTGHPQIAEERRAPDIVSIVMPYFSSLLVKDLKEGRGIWIGSGKRSYSESEINERRSLWNVHEPRTLDESYYIGLKLDQLSERNKDQVISRGANVEEDKKPLLMISQLWLWKMENYVIAALPHSSGMEPIKHIESELSDGNMRVGEDISSLQLTALILSECINFLDRPRSAGLEEPVFYTFEKAVATTFDKVQGYMKKKHLENIQLEEEAKFIHDINDIRDELAMIKNVIDQQEEVWNLFFNDLNEDEYQKWDPNLVRLITRPNEQIPKFIRRIDKIDKDAERVQNSILVQLDLKAKHAALIESHAALKESQNSTNLSIAVIGFTIITVIFTPLSFFSSLFALPIDHFHNSQVDNTDGSSVFTSSFIGKWMTVGEIVSLFVTAALVWLSFYYFKSLHEYTESKRKSDEEPNLWKYMQTQISSLKRFFHIENRAEEKLTDVEGLKVADIPDLSEKKAPEKRQARISSEKMPSGKIESNEHSNGAEVQSATKSSQNAVSRLFRKLFKGRQEIQSDPER